MAPYLQEIVPPVLACFSDQDARVRYYACESMYNIAKVAKGEILLFFNEIFDALSKAGALISMLSAPRLIGTACVRSRVICQEWCGTP